VDRHTRKELKTDKFALEIGHTFEYLSTHRTEVLRYGAVALAVLVIAGGYYYYTRHQADVREEALAQALKIDDATVGTNVLPTNLNYPTIDEKNKARNKAFTDLATKYKGTAEGAYAQIYLAADDADRGDLPAAEKRFREVMDSAPLQYAALARLSLADTLVAEGKPAEAEKILREAVSKPAATVSKEHATLILAQLVAKHDPCEARKMLDPLKTERSSVSRAVIQALGDTPPCVAK
jgi:predicted negative regulator of RcsB-dependent stress response